MDALSAVTLAIGTTKGLWLAHSDDQQSWRLDAPHLLAREVPSVAFDARGCGQVGQATPTSVLDSPPTLLVGA